MGNSSAKPEESTEPTQQKELTEEELDDIKSTRFLYLMLFVIAVVLLAMCVQQMRAKRRPRRTPPPTIASPRSDASYNDPPRRGD